MEHSPLLDNETTAMWTVLQNYQVLLAQAGKTDHPVVEHIQKMEQLLFRLEAIWEAPCCLERK